MGCTGHGARRRDQARARRPEPGHACPRRPLDRLPADDLVGAGLARLAPSAPRSGRQGRLNVRVWLLAWRRPRQYAIIKKWGCEKTAATTSSAQRQVARCFAAAGSGSPRRNLSDARKAVSSSRLGSYRRQDGRKTPASRCTTPPGALPGYRLRPAKELPRAGPARTRKRAANSANALSRTTYARGR